MELLLDSILDALHDTWLMLPLLYVVYLFLEYLQRKNDQNDSFFWNLQKYGPLFGALLGLIPQCGFSILAATLYVSRNITLGTMIAVFIATSDEAVPILISEPKLIPSLGLLLILKFVIAAACGFFIDHVLERHQKIIRFSELADEDELAQEEEDEEAIANSLEEQEAPSCSCCYPQYPLWLSALLRSAKIWLFIFLFSIVMNVITRLDRRRKPGSFSADQRSIPAFICCLVWLYSKLCSDGGPLPAFCRQRPDLWLPAGRTDYQCRTGPGCPVPV